MTTMTKTCLPLLLLVLLAAPGRGDEPIPHEAQVTEQVPQRVRDLLRLADRLELMAIICERQPDPGEEALGDPAVEDAYPVRRRVQIDGAPARVEVLGALYAGIAAPGPLAMCFEPHHALRATRGGEQVLLLLCYTCGQVEVREPDREPFTIGLGRAGEDVLNRVLGQEHTVPPDLLWGRPLAEWARRLHDPQADEEAREDACEALGGALTYEQPDLLVRTEDEPPPPQDLTPTQRDVAARRAVAAALAAAGERAGPAALKLTRAAAGDPDAEVRAMCARALQALTGEPLELAVDELAELAGGWDAQPVRLRALERLGALGPRAAAAAGLLGELADDEETPAPVRAAARAALEKVARR